MRGFVLLQVLVLVLSQTDQLTAYGLTQGTQEDISNIRDLRHRPMWRAQRNDGKA